MRKILTAALAAVTVAGASVGAAVPANAQHYHGGYGYGGGWHGGHGHGGNWGLPLAAGIAGLAVGAALADNHPYYRSYGYGYPAYGYGYPAYGYGPAYCEGGRWVWDPYIGRRVYVRETYPC